VESESVMDEDDLPVGLEGEDFDVEALDRLAEGRDIIPGDGGSSMQPAKRRKGSVGAGGRDASPAPSRLATPPLGTAAAAAGGGSRATPPLGGARRGSTPPLGSKSAGGSGSRQAAGGGSRRTPPLGGGGGPRRTPPPAAAAAAAASAGAGAAKRKREDAAAVGAAAAAAGAGAAPKGYEWRPDQLDATVSVGGLSLGWDGNLICCGLGAWVRYCWHGDQSDTPPTRIVSACSICGAMSVGLISWMQWWVFGLGWGIQKHPEALT
jgi:hypothetical protein